jgi:hypothetical protein
MARSKRDGHQVAFQKDYWREADARAVVEAWLRSGQPLSRFARGHGLQPHRLSRWAGRLQGKGRPVRFHPVRVVGGDGGERREAIEVVLVDEQAMNAFQGEKGGYPGMDPARCVDPGASWGVFQVSGPVSGWSIPAPTVAPRQRRT